MGGDRVIAVDIGGGSVKLALVDAAGDALETAVVGGVPDYDGVALLAELTRAAETLDAGARGRVRGMAIGVPGHLSSSRRASLNSNVPALDGMDLAGHFGTRLGYPVALENDANLAAIGEWRFGPWHAASRFLMVTLGTGIGVALIDGGKPVGFLGGTLGDTGHIIVDPTAGRACRLGCRGCLESVASGVALSEIAAEAAALQPDSPLGRLAGSEEISGAQLAGLAAAGDAATTAILSEVGRWLGMGLASYVNLFAPEVICIGGGMSRLRPFIERPMLAAMEQGRIKNRPAPEAVYFTDDFDLAAGRGAAALFFHQRNTK